MAMAMGGRKGNTAENAMSLLIMGLKLNKKNTRLFLIIAVTSQDFSINSCQKQAIIGLSSTELCGIYSDAFLATKSAQMSGSNIFCSCCANRLLKLSTTHLQLRTQLKLVNMVLFYSILPGCLIPVMMIFRIKCPIMLCYCYQKEP